MGIRIPYEVTEEKIDYPTLKLSAVVGADSFFCAITDEVHGPIFVLEHSLENRAKLFTDGLEFLPDLMAEHSILFEDFSEKRIAFSGMPYLIADEESEIHEKISEAIHIAAGDEIVVQPIISTGGYCGFAIPKAMHENVDLYFENATMIHSQHCFIEYCSNKEVLKEQPHTVICTWNGSRALLVVFEPDQLIFHNQYACRSAPDVAYFVQAAMDLLNLTDSDTQVLLVGKKLNDHNEVMQWMHQVKAQSAPFQTWRQETNDLFDLYTTAVCAL